MTFEQLSSELDRLHGLRFPPPDYRTHWEGLKGIPLPVIQRAVGEAAKGDDFPTPGELRRLADHSKPALALVEKPTTPLPEPVVIESEFFSKPFVVQREWHYYCDDCSDTGRWSVWCNRHPGSDVSKKPWMVVQRCTLEHCQDQNKVFYPHEWVTRCACWHTNPSLIRKRGEQARYAEQRANK